MSLINALRTSVIGMSSQANALSTIGANIANNTTVGYKTAGAEFEAMLQQTPTAILASGPVQTDLRYGITAQGTVGATSSLSDLAITGNGFFAVTDKNQATHLTRAGSFLPDASGTLINTAGYQLMGYAMTPTGPSASLSPVNISGATSIKFASDGTLIQFAADGTATATYKIPLANVQSANNLTTVDGNIFDVNEQTGAMSFSAPDTNGVGSLTSGALEQSTVDLGTQLTDMIQTQRSYEANSKALQASSDLMSVLKSLGN
jgi:flagellar hook protein FlgE